MPDPRVLRFTGNSRRSAQGRALPRCRRRATPLPEGIRSLDELESVIAEVARQEDERAKATVRELLDEELTLTSDESTVGLSIETVQRGRFAGQVIRDGKRIVYASLPATKKWLADNKWAGRPSRL